MSRNALAPAPPKTFPTMEGQVFEGRDGHVVHKTYLFAGVEDNDLVTCAPHPVGMYRFIACQADMMYRTRLTEGEIKRMKLHEQRRGLFPVLQMAHVARSLFLHWESDEYRSIELHNLQKGAEK
jgi:hypothetical protein